MGDYPDFINTIGKVFGSYNVVSSSTNLSSAGTATLMTVNGRGSILGGFIFCGGLVSCSADKPILVIDGVTLANITQYQLYLYGLSGVGIQPLMQTRYDDTGFGYMVTVKPELTFEESVVYQYYAASADLRSMKWVLNYTIL